MNDTQKKKIARFMSDEVMSGAVLEVLRETYLKKSPDRDVQNLAAQRIAIELLNDGWRELKKFKTEQEHEKTPGGNMAL
jgi:hypothetical protein